MCELTAIAAALALTAWHFVAVRRGRRSEAVFATMLTFWGAAIMWAVDCTANALDGEPFFDISREDAVLGGVVLLAGAAVFGVFSVYYAVKGGNARRAARPRFVDDTCPQ